MISYDNPNLENVEATSLVKQDSLISYDEPNQVINIDYKNVEAKILVEQDSLISYDEPDKFMNSKCENALENIVSCKSKSVQKSNRVSPCSHKSEKRSRSKMSKFFTNLGKNVRKGFARLLNNTGNKNRIKRRAFIGIPIFFCYR